MTESIKNNDELSPYFKALYLDIESQQRAVNSDRKSLDDLIKSAKWFGVIASVMVVGMGFFIGQSMNDVHNTAKQAAIKAFEDAVKSKTHEGANVSKIIEQAQNASLKINEIKESINKLESKLGLLNSNPIADPLINYYAIDKDIEIRLQKNKSLNEISNYDEIKDTVYDQEFRIKAAYIFNNLLTAAREGQKNNTPKIDATILYNAAANASLIDMDYISLELIEIAHNISKSPEIESRLIRMQLLFSRISPEEAIESLKAVLRRTPGFDIHHVLSEAFNIGLRTSNPVLVVAAIEESLDKSQLNISYVHLTIARLLLMGNTKADWDKAPEAFRKGLLALSNEPPSARWVDRSRDIVKKVLRENPNFIKEN